MKNYLDALKSIHESIAEDYDNLEILKSLVTFMTSESLIDDHFFFIRLIREALL